MEKNTDRLKFLLLKELAAKINASTEIDSLLKEALDHTLEIVNLVCASIILWDEKSKEVKNEVASGVMDQHKVLREFDLQAIRLMREKFSAESVYVTFDMEGPHSIFSYPIRSEKKVVGAITGLSRGHRNLSQEEEFLEALSNQLGLAVAKTPGWESKIAAEIQEGIIKSERLNAITETAVTINHEINNPLCAVLLAAELLLRREQELDPDMVKKLRKIEEAALQIKDVTHRLSKLIEPVIVKYAEGPRMIDLDKSKTKEEN